MVSLLGKNVQVQEDEVARIIFGLQRDEVLDILINDPADEIDVGLRQVRSLWPESFRKCVLIVNDLQEL
jgi:hypothetical protein